MGAIAIISIKWSIMDKSFKICIDRISNNNFFCMIIYNFASFIIWENTFETSCAISIIFYSSTSRINPIDTIGTSVSTSMCFTFICFSYCTYFTIRFITSLTASMCFTFIGFSYCTYFTIRFITSLTTSMCYTFIRFFSCTCFTIRFITLLSTSMCYTFITFTVCTCFTSRFITSFSSPMCDTFIGFTLCA